MVALFDVLAEQAPTGRPETVAAQRSRAAHLDGAHDAGLRQRQRMGRTVGLAVLSKNIGHFESGWWQRRYFCGLGGLVLLTALFFFAGWASASSGLRVPPMTCAETWV